MNALASIVVAALMVLAQPFMKTDDRAIVVICHEAPKETIDEKTLERIYLKRKMLWDDGRKVIPVNLPAQNPLRNSFSDRVLRRRHVELVDYWNEQHFRGITPPTTVESEEAVKVFVREVDGAVGYISARNLDPDLNVLYTIRIE
ncbi:MAG: hypothetical protein HY890_03270 [Deltaproteobacteria bacterium]|nr:hypothetical protein [Deltaproteobacteria bacterium]